MQLILAIVLVGLLALLGSFTLRVAAQSTAYSEVFRPQYHFSARSGWVGDPDGMIRYNNLYHIFWWGHAESSDLVHWNERPYPMIGDDGSFVYYSGSVVVDESNTTGLALGDEVPMIAVYTMHDKTTGEETQGLSISHDATNFHFYDQNPVLDSDEPAFRDPQVWFDEDSQRWLMVITLPEERKVSFYASNDLKQWEHLSDFGPIGARSQLWEVPDLFQLSIDGDANNMKWVLLCGMGPNREQYFIGDFDGTQFTLDPVANGYLLRGEGISGTLFADFENGLLDGWTAVGDPVAVGSGDNLGFYRVTGALGSGFLSTYTPDSLSGDRGRATISSPTFTIEHSAINFLISGGAHANVTAIQLLIDGEVVRSASGDNTMQMKWVGWDVSEFAGRAAQIQIVDDYTAGDAGFLNVDHIVFSNTLMETGREHANWLDYGPDYYAVRSYRDYDEAENRTVLMGWMGNWEYARDVPTSWGKGALALPREIELRSYAGGLKIVQRPIPALEGLRGDAVQVGEESLEGTRTLSEFTPARNTYEIEATFAITDPSAKFGLRLAINGDRNIVVGYDARTSNLFIDRTHAENGEFSGYFAKYATAPLQAQDSTVTLHIFVDQSSVEVFANDGDVTMTATILPNPGSTDIELFSQGGNAVLKELQAWELNSIWETEQR
jgi:fructan beta-fructosidase